MENKWLYALGGLLPHRLTMEVKDLYLSSLLQSLAISMLLLFEPIYLWQQGFTPSQIVYFFIIVYILYVVLMPLGAKIAEAVGYKHAMVLGALVQIAYYGCLFSITEPNWLMYAAALLYALQKTLYWPAYNALFAQYANMQEEGRELSGLTVAMSGAYIIGPLLAGVLLTLGSWYLLFVVASIVIVLSCWALLRHNEIFVSKPFAYLGAYKFLLARPQRRQLIAYLGFGEEFVALVFWPIYITTVVNGYAEVGAVVAAAALITGVATLYIGKLSDETNKQSVLRFSALLHSMGWFLRIMVVQPFQVLLSDAWSRLTKSIVGIPLTAITYERAHNGSVMQTVVFFEMSLALGKLLAMFVLLALFAVGLSWSAVWIVAGAMALLYSLL